MTAPVYTTRTNSDGSVEILESRPHWIATVASPQLAEALIAALAGPAPAPQPAPGPEALPDLPQTLTSMESAQTRNDPELEPLFPDDGDEGRCEQCQGECDQDGRCRYEDAEDGEAAEAVEIAEAVPTEPEATQTDAQPIDHGEDGIEIWGVLYSAALKPLPDQAEGIWTEEKDAWLLAAMDEEMPRDQIARILGHSEGACYQRHKKLLRDMTREALGVAV